MKIAVGSDHAGFELKQHVKQTLAGAGHELVDVGTDSRGFGRLPATSPSQAAALVAAGDADRGVLACGSGNGVAIVANKVARRPRRQRARRRRGRDGPPPQRRERDHAVRRAARAGGGRRDRRALPGRPSSRAAATRAGWTADRASSKGRALGVSDRRAPGAHRRPRCTELPPDFFNRPLADVDPEIADVLGKELERQQRTLEMIASENFVPQAVLDCQGSVLTNKYAEGYPGKRYYGGCEYVDIVEQLAIDRAKAALRRRARQRPAARRRADQRRRLPRAARAGRPDPRASRSRTAAT